MPKALLLFLSVLLMAISSAFGAEDRREIEFAGETWQVKDSSSRIEPGPNYWSDSLDSVWADDEGLHLTIRRERGRWYCSEVNTKRPTGYGTYTFVVDSPFAEYDPHVVAGFFTWDPDRSEANRELDIEFAAWGDDGGTKGQFVVQPYRDGGRIHIFDPGMQGTYSTHRIVWTPWSVRFSSYHGNVDPDDPASALNLMRQWEFAGTPPSSGNAAFRINLWLFRGEAPSSPEHLTVKSFSFEPLR